jgi:alkylation response protein AidB-like acyl-CoA dehydrogenase
LLRDSLRGFLAAHWPAAGAVERANQPDAVVSIWNGLVCQGVASLGTDPEEGGMREITILMEELGRAACPAPLVAATMANLAFGLRRETDPLQVDNRGADLLAPLHNGAIRLGLAFASLDPDAESASLAWSATVTGTLRFVDAANCLTHLLVVMPDHQALARVDLSQPGITVTATRAMGGPGVGEIHLDRAKFDVIPLGTQNVRDLLLVTRLALLARAHGAARRAFEMVVAYALERHQFGQLIGRFQAVQHKLANNLIALEGVRLTLNHAAEAFDLGAAQWRYFGWAAVAIGAASLRQVALETHHAFGAIGYAEEHEAPRHFRRVHSDVLALGGVAAARRELAALLLDQPDASLPTYDLGAAGNEFRQEVRAWLQQNWQGERKAAFDRQPFHSREFEPDFAKDLGATGWIGQAWPREFGGQARSPLEQLAFVEVMESFEAPRIGAGVQANALMMHGTPEQQARYLPEILRGEAMHGMGYSEPDAGSDLAALRTSAVKEGDGWRINGQKIWTTTYWGKYMFLAARTDHDAKPRHAGISMFIVPMDAPGISVKSAATMYDGSFANIFYDNVVLPADALLGPVNGGWKVLTDALANERGVVGGGIVLKVVHAFNCLCADLRKTERCGKPLCQDPLVRDRVGSLAAEIEVGRQLMVHCAELATSGTTPPEMGAISKVFSGELMERFGEAALDLLGPLATLSQDAPGALRNGRYEQNLRHSLMWVISIGTNEIQRSLIAQRGLGLPR